ncbi:MAG: hypothetical protein ABR575_05495 [Actinomycetota bacterium]
MPTPGPSEDPPDAATVAGGRADDGAGPALAATGAPHGHWTALGFLLIATGGWLIACGGPLRLQLPSCRSDQIAGLLGEWFLEPPRPRLGPRGEALRRPVRRTVGGGTRRPWLYVR